MFNHHKNTLYKLNISIVLSILCFLLIALGISILYHPDISLIKLKAEKLLIPIIVWAVNPEPKEKLIYLIALIVFPSLIGLFLFLFRNKSFSIKQKTIIEIGSIITYCLLLLVTLLAKDNYNEWSLNIGTYFGGLIQYKMSYIDIIVTVLLFLFYTYVYQKKHVIGKKIFFILGVILFFILPLLTVFLGNITSFPHGSHHFDAVFYSQNQVENGVPMLVDGFTNTYGLYPHFLHLIFKIIGLSILKFTLVNSLLIVICFASLFWFLLRETKNKFISIIGIGSIIFSYIFWKHQFGDAYFQFFPIRTIFPCLMLLFASFFNTNRNKFLYVFISIFCALNLLWNPDIGIFTNFSWIAFVIYLKTIEKQNVIEKFKLGIITVFISISIVILTLVCFQGIMFLSYKTMPDLSLLFSTIFVFSGLGFYMLPMQLIHPWIIFAIWVLIGFGLSINSYFNFKKDNAILFLLTLVCIGFFCYYQGRSHSFVFIALPPFFLMLLCLLLSKINIKSTSIQLKTFAIAGFFILMMTIPSMTRLNILFLSDKNILYGKNETPEMIKSNIAFIKKYTKPGEKILIRLTDNYQGLYHNATQTISVFNPGFIELFFNSDIDRLNKLLQSKQIKIFELIKLHYSTFIHVADNGEIGYYLNKIK